MLLKSPEVSVFSIVSRTLVRWRVLCTALTTTGAVGTDRIESSAETRWGIHTMFHAHSLLGLLLWLLVVIVCIGFLVTILRDK